MKVLIPLFYRPPILILRSLSFFEKESHEPARANYTLSYARFIRGGVSSLSMHTSPLVACILYASTLRARRSQSDVNGQIRVFLSHNNSGGARDDAIPRTARRKLQDAFSNDEPSPSNLSNRKPSRVKNDEGRRLSYLLSLPLLAVFGKPGSQLG